MKNKTEYDKQAEKFLSAHGLKLRIVESNTNPANWEPSGNHYRVTLSAAADVESGKGGRRMTFDFWGSHNDMLSGEHPSAYDVLACINSDIYTPESFEDFCSEYGYEADSIKALQTFRRADRFARRLRDFLTPEQAEALTEIH